MLMAANRPIEVLNHAEAPLPIGAAKASLATATVLRPTAFSLPRRWFWPQTSVTHAPIRCRWAFRRFDRRPSAAAWCLPTHPTASRPRHQCQCLRIRGQCQQRLSFPTTQRYGQTLLLAVPIQADTCSRPSCCVAEGAPLAPPPPPLTPWAGGNVSLHCASNGHKWVWATCSYAHSNPSEVQTNPKHTIQSAIMLCPAACLSAAASDVNAPVATAELRCCGVFAGFLAHEAS